MGNKVNLILRRGKLVFFILLIILAFSSAYYVYLKKSMQYWLLPYFKWEFTEKINLESVKKPIHIMFLIVDHFEPTTIRNMDDWYSKFLTLVKDHKDADGFPLRYTWFYFADGYKQDVIEKIAELCRMGLGEIELQLHHCNDTPDTFREKVMNAKKLYRKAGALYTVDGKEAFGYIAGNWALDNSVIRNSRNYSGVNNEIQILKEEGCYADFTFPSVNMAQPEMVNKIYYAFDDPKKPKSYNTGIVITKLKTRKYEEKALVIFEGPLFINWKDWRHKIYPVIEVAQIHGGNPPTELRLESWIKAAVHVKGKPNWIFLKTFTHGASPKNKDVLFSSDMENMINLLEIKYNDGQNYVLHYVTAREAYNIVKAAEYGLEGNPNQFRDFIIQPYENSKNRETL
jgi:hypothetical protein